MNDSPRTDLGRITEALEELESLRYKNVDLEKGLHMANVSIQALQAQLNGAHQNVTDMQAQRDEAIANRAIYEALFASVLAMLNAFKVPVTILSPRVAETINQEQADVVVAQEETNDHK